MTYIPLRNKLKIKGVGYAVNEKGIPCCPRDPSLLMKREGSKSHLRCGPPAMKYGILSSKDLDLLTLEAMEQSYGHCRDNI